MSEEIANDTWRKGFLHLTVDGEGLVSLWDYPFDSGDLSYPAVLTSYLRLPLTEEQVKMIEDTMKKGGFTP